MSRRRSLSLLSILALAAVALAAADHLAAQQWTPLKPGSDNITVVSHLPLGPKLSVSDIEIIQELDHPYAFVGRMVYGYDGDKGVDIIDLNDPARPKVVYRWRIENQDLHTGTGGMDVKYFMWNDRYYVVQSLQFGQGGPDSDMGAVVLDITGLPDPSTVKEVARIRVPEHPGGFHNIFVYKHSNGRVLLISTGGPYAKVHDLGYMVEGRADEAWVATIPAGPDCVLERSPTGTEPTGRGGRGGGGGRRCGYHDMYAGYHPDTETDRFYGGGAGGYYVYDMTDLENPQMIVSLTGITGVSNGHTFTPSPDGRYVIAETEYQYAPLRIFDLQPALEGQTTNISRPISAWTADWRNLVHNHEVRWPYVFVSGYHDGLQVFSMMDPEDPVTVAYYDTYIGPPAYPDRPAMFNGAFGVDIRNADGLIVVSDMNTGFWAFRMDGFLGWDGPSWGMPDVSSAQKWIDGPGGSR
jgi:hypothetical protein